MAFKSILVHLDSSLGTLARLQTAIALAREHSAHLIGLFVFARHYYATDTVDLSLRQLEGEFSNRTAQAGITASWKSVDVSTQHLSVAQVVNFHAYFSDLIIVGQEFDSCDYLNSRSDQPDCLIIGSGRPVLVVPTKGTFENIGKKVMVAWRLGREATRAIHDAMPILKYAEGVDVVVAKHQKNDVDGVELLFDHLSRHGISSKFETILSSEISLGDALLNKASDKGADVRVLGVYSRTNFGTLALGDVGKHLLKHATLPVLMSH